MADNGKLPKRVAGVKLPKAVRKSGGQLRAMLAGPIAQGVFEKLISAALLAAAAKLAESATARRAGDAVKAKGRKAPPERKPQAARKPRAARKPGKRA